MASFAAVLGRSAPPDRERVEAMLRASAFRGEVLGTATVGRCALGVSGEPDDPLVSIAVEDGWAAAVAGAVDNAPELASSLGIDGAGEPARVALRLVRSRGSDAIAELRGPFSLAVTDGERLFVARDHLGFRSVYFREEPAWVFAATDAAQVLAGAGLAPEPDLEVVEAIYFGEYDRDTPGALRGVRRLAKGELLRGDPSGAVRARYWRPERLLETIRGSDAELGERFDALMRQAASRALTGADVISLSGGIDSPTVAAFAAPIHLERFGRPLPALSVVYPDLPSVDETRYIEEVAAALGLPLHTYEESARALDGVEEVARALSGPVPRYFAAEAMEHYRRARALGFRSTLTGELAEWIVSRKDHFVPHLLLHGRWGALRRHLREQRARGVRWRWLLRQLALALEVPAVQRWRALHGRAAVPTPPWLDDRRLRAVAARHAVRARDRWRELQVALPRGVGLAEEAQDVVQDLCGVRTRPVFGDVDVCEFFIGLPAERKFPETRRKGFVVRRMRGRVPDSVLDRERATVFNDAVVRRADYDAMKRYLVEPPVRLRGVDYDVLAERLEAGNMDIVELEYAKNLAAVHAFLARW
ncbi:MAG: asparagine synthetase B [Actinomycetota bacterium]|nr:MAG: asparagine synthetase B [Actinomycetota bacterium]